MKTKSLIVVAVAATLLSGTFAFKMLSSGWKINSKEAVISFSAEGGKHHGTIAGLDATINFDPTSADLGSIKAIVNVPTISTGTDQLDHHLQTADFFDAANHPTITFTTESISKNDSGYVATGKLAMRDSVHTVSVPFKFVQKDNMASMKGTMSIYSGDYGVGKKSDKGNDLVVITIEVPMIKE